MAEDSSIEPSMKLLGKKATFERGVRSLTRVVESEKDCALASRKEELLGAVWRVATLLKTRYTARGFWAAGSTLFNAAVPLTTGNKEAEGKLREILATAQDALGEQNEDLASVPQTQPQRPVPYHFEGQLSLGSDPPPRGPPGLAQAESLLLNAMAQALREGRETRAVPSLQSLTLTGAAGGDRDQASRPSPDQPQPQTDAVRRRTRGGGGDDMEDDVVDDVGDEVDGSQRPRSLSSADEDGIPDVNFVLDTVLSSIVPDDIPGLEEALEASLQQGAQSHGAPPASRKVVEKLPTMEVTGEEQESVGKLGSESKAEQKFCAVCQEEWRVGDRVRQMPCSHRFHLDCLQPWLEQRNSCPMCRLELPTDDIQYELRKEREMQEAEERAGAANAVEEGVYMYL